MNEASLSCGGVKCTKFGTYNNYWPSGIHLPVRCFFLFFLICQLRCVLCDCNTANFFNVKFGFYSQYSNSFPEEPIIQLCRYRVFKYISQIPQKSIKLKKTVIWKKRCLKTDILSNQDCNIIFNQIR